MKIVAVMLMLLFARPAFSQPDPMKVMAAYEGQKKDVGTALLFSSLLPGGGLFYAGEVRNGIAFLSFETANLLLLFERRNSGDSYGVYVATLLVLKAFEYLFAVRDVERYNDQLRSTLGLTITMGVGGTLRAGLSLNF